MIIQKCSHKCLGKSKVEIWNHEPKSTSALAQNHFSVHPSGIHRLSGGVRTTTLGKVHQRGGADTSLWSVHDLYRGLHQIWVWYLPYWKCGWVMGGLCPSNVQPGSFLLLYLDGDRVPPVLLGIQKEKKAALWVRGHRATGRSRALHCSLLFRFQ